jgi:UDP-2,3-diacylglucosamine pyrophosphatase LpxH
MPAPTWTDADWLKDPKLKTFATRRQAEFIDAVLKHGTMIAAAKALGVQPSVLSESLKRAREAAAKRGYSPAHDMHHTVPDGFKVKGVSTYYDKEGMPRGQWVKSSEDAERAEALLRAFVEHLTEEARALYPSSPAPSAANSDVLACYLFGDPHFGMRGLKDDGADDFDTDEADRLTRAGIDRLAEAMPDAEQALLIVIGDNTHSNDGSHKTPGHGNPLDMDYGGHSRAMLISAKAWSYACRRLLAKHAKVKLWFMPGNHDPDASFALALCLSMYFEGEPRIEVDLSRGLYRCMRFGKVLIGAHHGHGAKQADLPLLMAVDNAEDWGASTVRYVYQGHIHHDSVKEIQGVRVESIRTLAGKDAWHAGQGYRSMRDTRGIVHHKDYGEIERHTVSAAMLS